MPLPPISSIKDYVMRLELLNIVYSQEDYDSLTRYFHTNFAEVTMLSGLDLGFINKYPSFAPVLNRKTGNVEIELWAKLWNDMCKPILVRDLSYMILEGILVKYQIKFKTHSVYIVNKLIFYEKISLDIDIYDLVNKRKVLPKLKELVMGAKSNNLLNRLSIDFSNPEKIQTSFLEEIKEIEQLYKS